jgi:hypothetical protein
MSAADGFNTTPTYKETVFRFRVVRNRADAERNPNGEWSLVYSCNTLQSARDELVDMARDLPVGDAIKIVDGGKETTIERPVY